MADLYEYYNTGDDGYGNLYDERRYAQTFTPSIAHEITSVKLLLFRDGSPGTITVSIRATDVSGHPTGSDLCSGTIDGNTLTTDTDGLWYEITLGAGFNLNADTKYAIVMKAASTTPSHMLCPRRDESSPTYERGNYDYSSDSGSTWTADTERDFMFEEWGVVIEAPTVTTQAADSIETTTANPKGNVTDTGEENPTRYIDYDTDSGEPYAHSKDCGVGGVGEYDSNLTDLSPGQKYYYRARAVNSGGTDKGDEMTFTTKEGGTEDCGVGGVGPYEKVISGLTPNTTYRFKARGVNSGGTGTGVEKEFTTLAS